MPETALHHIALACRDPEATRHFYEDLIGFPLLHAEAQSGQGALVKHFFFDMGDGSCIAFFDLHNAGEPPELHTAISTDLGLPIWCNHIAFRRKLEDFGAIKKRLAEGGIQPTMEMDHGWCTSIYYMDPNGILVEFCADTPGMPVDAEEAREVLKLQPESVTA